MDKILKLSIFDFDSTLVSSPLPETGRQEYEEKTGKTWPHHGWWGKEESLDHTIFDIPVIPNVIEDYQREKALPNTAVIMLTGRMQKLAHKVMDILQIHNLEFDGYFFNRGGSTDTAKIKTMEELLQTYPNVQEIEQWDDRISHVELFQKWGEALVESGRLKSYKVHLVISDERDGLH